MNLHLQNKFQFLLSIFVICFTLISCSSDKNENSQDNNVINIEFAPLISRLAVGTQINLQATAYHRDGSRSDISNTITWSTNNPDVATISESGLLTAKSLGDVTVRGTLNNLFIEKQIQVSGATLQSISVNASSFNIVRNTHVELSAIALFSDGSKLDVSQIIQWHISDTNRLKAISENTFEGIAAGEVLLTGNYLDQQSTITLTVVEESLVSLEIETSANDFYVGTELAFTVTGFFSNNTKAILTPFVTWSFSNEKLIDFDESKATAILTGAGSLVVTATIENISIEKTINIKTPQLLDLEIIPQSSSLTKFETNTLKVFANYSNGKSNEITADAFWSSDNSAIVEVSNAQGIEGEILAIAAGEATITTVYKEIQSSLTITVKDLKLQGIEITPTSVDIANGYKSQLTATGLYEDNSTRNINHLVNWESLNDSILLISNQKESAGEVTALQEGETEVSASADGLEDKINITITAAILKEININIDRSIPLHSRTAFDVIGVFSDDTSQNITDLVSFSSADENILSFEKSIYGEILLEAHNSGETVITASFSDVSQSIPIKVINVTLSEVKIESDFESIGVGTSTNMRAIAYYSNESTRDVTAEVSWSVSDNEILQISNNPEHRGLVTANKAGQASISASYQSLSSEYILVVNEAILLQIEVIPESNHLAVNVFTNIRAIGVYDNQQRRDISQDVVWSSSAPDIIFVSNALNSQGQALALSSGDVTITASFNGVQASTQLTVADSVLTGITILSENGNTLANGSNKQLTAIANYSNGQNHDVTNQVSWQSSDKSICNISTAAENFGMLTGLSIGTCNITASLNSVNATILFNVSDAVLDTIELSANSIQLALGTSISLQATGAYSDGSHQDITTDASWRVLNDELLNINNQGGNTIQLTTLREGSSNIEVSYAGITTNTDVSVTSATLQSISITPDNSLISLGLAKTFTATGLYSDQSTQNITDQVFWQLNNVDQNVTEAIAIVSNTNTPEITVTGLSAGITTLSASLGTVSTQTNIEIVADPTAAASLAMAARPYVILNDGIDQTTITINVRAVDDTQTVADGTVINLQVINGEISLNANSVSTINGQVELNLTSTYKGIITIKASIEDSNIENYVSIYSTDQFAEIIGRAAFFSGTLTADNKITAGSQFGFLIVNFANRNFNLLAYAINNDGQQVSLLDDPALLSDGILEAGENILLIYTTPAERNNSYAAAYLLEDESTGTQFVVAVNLQLSQ